MCTRFGRFVQELEQREPGLRDNIEEIKRSFEAQEVERQEAALKEAAWAIHESDAWGEPCDGVGCQRARQLSRRMAEQAIAAYLKELSR